MTENMIIATTVLAYAIGFGWAKSFYGQMFWFEVIRFVSVGIIMAAFLFATKA